MTFDVGYLPQDAGAHLEPTLTVAENVAEPIFQRDKHYNRRRSAGERAATMLDTVHLPLSVLNKYPYELSAGQRQRVAIARALVLDPSMLVADEPTAGIDATVRDAIIDLIGELQRARGFSALVVSHDLAVLRRGDRRIAVLQDGVWSATDRSTRCWPTRRIRSSRARPRAEAAAAADRAPTAALRRQRSEADRRH